MIFLILIFTIAIILAFGMLFFRAWEIRTSRFKKEQEEKIFTPELSFRYIEKIVLYLTKYIIQWIVLSSVKFWFVVKTKTKILLRNKLPKINQFFKRKNSINDSRKITFIQRAVMESKIKIRKVKEKIIKEHEEVEEGRKIEVDKIL